MICAPVFFARRGTKFFQYEESAPPPASSTIVGPRPGVTWKASLCPPLLTMCSVDPAAGLGMDDVAGGAEAAFDPAAVVAARSWQAATVPASAAARTTDNTARAAGRCGPGRGVMGVPPEIERGRPRR